MDLGGDLKVRRRLDMTSTGRHSQYVTGLDWKRLGRYVAARRDQMGHDTTRSFAIAIGMSEKQAGRLERGEGVGRNTLTKTETFLGWEPGSAAVVLAGGVPTLVDDNQEFDRARRSTRQKIIDMTDEEVEDFLLKVEVTENKATADRMRIAVDRIRAESRTTHPTS